MDRFVTHAARRRVEVSRRRCSTEQFEVVFQEMREVLQSSQREARVADRPVRPWYSHGLRDAPAQPSLTARAAVLAKSLSARTETRRRHRIPACLRLSSGTTSTRSSVRSRSFRKENPSEVKNPTSLQKKIGTRIVDRDAKALIAVTDAAALSSAGEPKLVDLVQDRQSSDDVIEQ